MKNDPLIDEIRQICHHQISAEFDHNTKKMFAYYKPYHSLNNKQKNLILTSFKIKRLCV